MNESHSVQRVREGISRWMVNHGLSADPCLDETILIRNGNFCGRRFQCEGYQAIWFVEEGVIKLSSPQGGVVMTTTADKLAGHSAQEEPTRRAA